LNYVNHNPLNLSQLRTGQTVGFWVLAIWEERNGFFMSDFTVYPAIDLRKGSVVRLIQGDLDRTTTYGSDPASAAQSWVDAGTSWIHVVNLDGAFGEDKFANNAALAKIVKVTSANGVKVQFGGGMRSMVDVKVALDLGVDRVILGTAAANDLDLVTKVIALHGSKAIGIGIDARDGYVRTHGWQETTRLTPVELGLQVKERGAQLLVFTNIARDGAGTGVDIPATLGLAVETGLDVIASGGVSSLDDICQVKGAGLPGVIIGRALYENQVDLKEALAC
jgi:phosphoribosylformimino-5-aminoimidazole carboxamide ribotide isomerase